jgi:hypothetical protein
VILCVPEVTGVGVMIGNFINCMQPGGYDNRRWSRKEDSGKTFVFIRWSHSDHGQQAVVFSAKGLDPSKIEKDHRNHVFGHRMLKMGHPVRSAIRKAHIA